MIVDFVIGNFLSYKEQKSFGLLGSNFVKEHEGEDNMSNVFDSPTLKYKLLKSSVFYGANASGKSNLLKALGFYKNFILKSFNTENPDKLMSGAIPFLLNADTENQPCYFEMTFFIDQTRYRYGFEVSNLQVHMEWLFSLEPEKTRESLLFTRTIENGIDAKFKEGKNKNFQIATRDNALFLSTLAQFNTEVSKKIQNWFRENLIIISGADSYNLENAGNVSIHKFLNEDKFRYQMIAFFKAIRIGFEYIDIVQKDKIAVVENRDKLFQSLLSSKFPTELVSEFKNAIDNVQQVQNKMNSFNNKDKKEEKHVSVQFEHNQFDASGHIVGSRILDWALQSEGTKKLFNLFGIWMDTIDKGKILIIDELDASLHTQITQELIKLFHNEINLKAQLIFAVHDTNLLKKELFRRDQIWFAEKDKEGATDIYSLIEYKDVANKAGEFAVRNDASFEKGYLEGKYGALPYLGDINKFLKDFIYDKAKEVTI